MSLGSNTQVVDGQRNIFPTGQQYTPMSYGQQTTGVPNVSPSMPPFMGSTNGPGSSMGLSEGVGGYGTAGNNATVTAIAAEHPHNLKVSPVWWAVIFLIVGILLLRGVHWRKTTLEGASADATFGGSRAAASERVD